MPGMDVLLNVPDLCRDRYILPSKNIETQPRGSGNAIVILSSNDLEQLGRVDASLRRDNAELSHMPSDRIVR